MDQPRSAKMDQVVQALKTKGATDEQIAQVVAEVTKTVMAKMYSDAALTLSEEDLKAIENASDQEGANYEIRERFSEKTGQSVDEVMAKYLDLFADKFLEDYQKEQAGQPIS